MKKHPHQTVAIIGHGATGTLLACYIKAISSTFEEDPKANGFYFLADWENKTASSWQKY